MKIAVIEAFFDKDTNEPYNRGDVYEGDKDRIAELRAAGFLADVVKETPVAAETKTDGENNTGTDGSKGDGATDATKTDTKTDADGAGK